MKYVLAILFGVLFLSCQSKNDIIRVDLARSGAWSDLGGALSIDSSLKYNFCRNARVDGKLTAHYFTGKATRQFWDTLTQKLGQINYNRIDSMDNMGGSDISYFELIINWKDSRLRIIRMQNFNPDNPVGNLIDWLDTSYKQVSLKSTKTPFAYQTTYQAGGFEVDQIKYFENLKKVKNSKWNLNKVKSVNHEILSDHAIQR